MWRVSYTSVSHGTDKTPSWRIHRYVQHLTEGMTSRLVRMNWS